MTYFTAGSWGGVELLLGILLVTREDIEAVERWIRVLLPTFALLGLLYVMSAKYPSTTGLAPVRRILTGDPAPHIYFGVVLVGLTFPIIVLVYSLTFGSASVEPPAFLTAIGLDSSAI